MKLILTGLILSSSAFAQPVSLFKFKNQEVKVSDLTVADQQAYFEIVTENHGRLEDFVDRLLVQKHIQEKATELKVSQEEAEQKVFGIGEPTDQQAQAWYDANKDRVPPQYTFDQIKKNIKDVLVQEQTAKKREELLASLKSGGTGVSLLVEPQIAPITINTKDRPMKGSAKAKVNIVEFADFQCPHCKMAVEDIGKIMKKYEGKINLVYLDFPINPSGISKKVALGAFCANKQGKYWEYHEMAFAEQKNLGENSPTDFATKLKLKESDFKTCYQSPEALKKVDEDIAEGKRVGVSGTPTIFVNGRKVRGHDESELTKMIEKALKEST